MLEHEHVEWPVAEIPDPDRPTIQGAVMMPLRWPHHGDLRILVTGHRTGAEPVVWVLTDDLWRLLEIDDLSEAEMEAATHGGALLTIGTWRDPAGPLVDAWLLSDALRWVQDFPTHQTAGFTVWLQGILPSVVTDEVLDGAIGLETFLDAWTVQQAAVILDRDPAVAMGRQRLFELLEHLALIARDEHGHWIPTSLAIRRGWLTVRPVHVSRGPSKGRYDQVHVTRDGLAELRRCLHTVGAGVADDIPTPTLFS